MHEHRPAEVSTLAVMVRGLAGNVPVEGRGHILSSSKPAGCWPQGSGG